MIQRVISDPDFPTNFALGKKICIFNRDYTAGWRAMREWVNPEDGKSVDVEYLNAQYGMLHILQEILCEH